MISIIYNQEGSYFKFYPIENMDENTQKEIKNEVNNQ